MDVSPFRGICYNQRIVGDLARVFCPPYDVITPEQQKLYYKENSYNAAVFLLVKTLENKGGKS